MAKFKVKDHVKVTREDSDYLNKVGIVRVAPESGMVDVDIFGVGRRAFHEDFLTPIGEVTYEPKVGDTVRVKDNGPLHFVGSTGTVTKVSGNIVSVNVKGLIDRVVNFFPRELSLVTAAPEELAVDFKTGDFVVTKDGKEGVILEAHPGWSKVAIGGSYVGSYYNFALILVSESAPSATVNIPDVASHLLTRLEDGSAVYVDRKKSLVVTLPKFIVDEIKEWANV